MAKSKDETASAPEVETPAEQAGSTGVRSRRAFMLKQFVPEGIDWINKNVVAKGKGSQVILGRVVGFVTGTNDKENTLPDGTPSKSIVLVGQFEAEDYRTGEVSSASNVYLPMSIAEQIKSMFVTDESLKVVEIDCDIGLEATGKTIPYTWVVINHREGMDLTPLKKLRLSRKRPANALALEAPKNAGALEAPK